MAAPPTIWLCTNCITSFDANSLTKKQASAGCPRCQSRSICWSLDIANYLFAGGLLAAAFAMLEFESQQVDASFYHYHRGDAYLLSLILHLGRGEKPTITRRAVLKRRLRLSARQLALCVN